jgi:hypothetical protein
VQVRETKIEKAKEAEAKVLKWIPGNEEDALNLLNTNLGSFGAARKKKAKFLAANQLEDPNRDPGFLKPGQIKIIQDHLNFSIQYKTAAEYKMTWKQLAKVIAGYSGAKVDVKATEKATEVFDASATPEQVNALN